MMADPYFVAKARARFAALGGDPDNAGPLAEWAQEAQRIGDPRRGVIVAYDGELIAGTLYHPATASKPGVSYIDREDSERYQLFGHETGLATAQLMRITGKRLVHVTMPEVCRGAGKYVPEVPGGKPAGPLDRVAAAVEDGREASRALRVAVADAYSGGAKITELAAAAEVSRQTIYRWLTEAGFTLSDQSR